MKSLKSFSLSLYFGFVGYDVSLYDSFKGLPQSGVIFIRGVVLMKVFHYFACNLLAEL